MVKRQPGRPTEQEFIGAALRFVEGDYPEAWTCMPIGFGVIPVPVAWILQKGDQKIIRTERDAEGLRGVHEDLASFAIRQVALYQRSY